MSGRLLERLFAALALLLGIAYALVTPPIGAPDEGTHLVRSYLLSEGRIRVPLDAAEATVPASLVRLERAGGAELWPPGPPVERHPPEVLWRLLALADTPDERVPIRYVVQYGPVAHAAPALAMALGRLADASITAQLYLGRLANVLVWVVTGWLAIRLAPIRRAALAMLGLLPMPLFLSGSVSADPITTGLAMLLAALVLRATLAPAGALPLRECGALLAVLALLGLTKPGYWLLAAAVLAIPRDRFATPRLRLAFCSAAALAALGPSLLWYLHTLQSEFVLTTPGADAGAQLRLLVRDPMHGVSAIAATLAAKAYLYAITFLGVLGRLEVVLPGPLYAAAALALPALALADRRDPPRLDLRRRLGFAGLFVGSALLLLALTYLASNPVGAPRIEGVQGRYLLPLAPWLLPVLPGLGARGAEGGQAALVAALALSTNAFALWALARFFYAW